MIARQLNQKPGLWYLPWVLSIKELSHPFPVIYLAFCFNAFLHHLTRPTFSYCRWPANSCLEIVQRFPGQLTYLCTCRQLFDNINVYLPSLAAGTEPQTPSQSELWAVLQAVLLQSIHSSVIWVSEELQYPPTASASHSRHYRKTC